MLSVIRDVFDAFIARARSVLAPHASLEIVQQDDNQLTLKNNSRELIVRKQFGDVQSGSHVVVRSDAIETIDVARHRTSDKAPDYWAVRLNVKGSNPPVIIGYSLDAVEASVVAAQISTLTGKKARAL